MAVRMLLDRSGAAWIIDWPWAAVGAHWYDTARRPASADMPTIRAFQKAEADAAVTWLSRRWSQ